jgi:cell pole-organizing protein PopZ
MSDPKPKSEPSMDEILATVRRIIAEDESDGAPAPASAPIVSSDVLDLTEALEPDGTVRHIAPFGGSPPNPNEPRVPPLSDGRIEPEPPRSAAATETADRQESPGRSAEANEGASLREPRGNATSGQEARIAPTASTPPEGIPEGEVRLGGGERTLEDITRELLRPMLQRWLQENLQGIIEQEVRAQLARAAIEPEQRRPSRGKRTARE